jgi:hypothetical protein
MDKIQEAQLNQQAITNEHLDALHTLSGELNEKIETMSSKVVLKETNKLLADLLAEQKKECKISIKLNLI